MKLGEIKEVSAIKADINEQPLDKKDYGYVVRAEVNGWKICAPDRNLYEAYKACLEAAEVMSEREPYERKK